MKKKCNICNKNKKQVCFRKNRGRCKKCEYETRKEYLKKYSKEHYIPYKNLPEIKKEKIRSNAIIRYRHKNNAIIRYRHKSNTDSIIENKKKTLGFKTVIKIII